MKNKKILVKILSFILIIFYILNINNTQFAVEKQAEEKIEFLIQLFKENGVTKSTLTEAVKAYKEISKENTNQEIVTMLEKSKEKLKNDDVAKENIDNICKVLKTFDTEKLNMIIEKSDLEQVLSQMESGATLLQIIEKATTNMSTTDKVNLIMSIAWSANIIRIAVKILIALEIYKILVRCIIYKKAKKQAWAILIPIYRDIVMLKICGMSPWWLLLLLVPIIGWIILWLVHVASKFMLAEAFNKKQAYGLGLWLLWPIFESILAFSKKSKYIGIEK